MKLFKLKKTLNLYFFQFGFKYKYISEVTLTPKIILMHTDKIAHKMHM